MALNDTERALAKAAGLSETVLLTIRRHTRKKLERFRASSERGTAPGPGVSVTVADGEEAERLMQPLVAELRGTGCQTFWSERASRNGLKQTDEVAVVGTDDPYAAIRLRRTDGANYDISTDDIIERLRAWEELCSLRVVGAASSWVALQFQTLPQISQRLVHGTDDVLAQLEGMDPAAAQQFRDLLDAASAGSIDERDGVRLLAEDLHRRKYLFLWWD